MVKWKNLNKLNKKIHIKNFFYKLTKKVKIFIFSDISTKTLVGISLINKYCGYNKFVIRK